MDEPTFSTDEIDQMRHPPYHLRTNKAVDRLLLVDVIRRLGSESNYADFTYYSLAGPFLEDLRVMDHFFPEMNLVSMESNEHTWKRQNFNQFCSRLELMKVTLSDFLIHEYPNRKKTKDIFWLDFTDLKLERFNEFQQILKDVLPDSIIRITLRAEPEATVGFLRDILSEGEYQKLLDELTTNFIREFDSIIPPDIHLSEAFEKPTRFALLVQNMIKIAASQALDLPGSDVDFLPIQSTRYNDNTQMISVTGVVCQRTDIDQIRNRLQTVRYTNFDWNECRKIDIPALSVKERLHLERFLPIPDGQDPGQMLYDALEYSIDNGEKRSKLQLTHYAECHRSYPNFVQVAI